MATLLLSFVFGTIGFSFFIYGKKQRRTVPWLAGIGLCVFPYFVPNMIVGVVIGSVLTLTPFFVKSAQ